MEVDNSDNYKLRMEHGVYEANLAFYRETF